MQHGGNTNQSYFEDVRDVPSIQSAGIDKSLMSIRSTWPSLVADLTYQYGSAFMQAETVKEPPRVSPNGNWVQGAGASSLGQFNIYMPAKLCASLLELSDDALDISQLDGTDGALILEYVFSERLAHLETLTNADIEIKKLTDVTVHVSEELFGFDLKFNGDTFHCAVSFQPALKQAIEGLCAERSMPEEKYIEPKMVVHLGPVIVPARQAYLARMGEAIDCGVNPSDTIRGVLLRSDGRYWPVHIEDEEIEIVGELSAPISPPDPDAENLFVTFGLGDVTLSAFERSQVHTGQRLSVNRLPANGAQVFYQAKPFGEGHLSILGPNLAVTLDRIGVFEL